MIKPGCYLCQNKVLMPIANEPWLLYRCMNCRLVQAIPIPTIQQINQMYQGDYWKNYSFYDSQHFSHLKYFQKKISEISKSRKNGSLLDVGCATGKFLQIAINEGYKTQGIDISDYAVKQCMKSGLKASKEILATHNKNKKYDIITAFEIVEHERDPLNFIRKAHKHLNKNGLMVVTVPDSNTLTARIMGKKWFGYKNKEHIFHFTNESLQLLFKKAGFTNFQIKKDDYRPYLLIYYLERINYYLFKWKFIDKFTNQLKKIPIINSLFIPFNPWGNLIVYAYKN